MKVYIYEGTPEEIRRALPGLPTASEVAVFTPLPVIPTADTSDDDDDEEQTYVSLEVARAVINRRKLHDSQKAMLTAIYAAHPDPISALDLQALLSQTTAQFRGFMGAWGRRYTHTPGFVDGDWFFDQEWDDEQACYLYSLPETVREAMKLEKLV